MAGQLTHLGGMNGACAIIASARQSKQITDIKALQQGFKDGGFGKYLNLDLFAVDLLAINERVGKPFGKEVIVECNYYGKDKEISVKIPEGVQGRTDELLLMPIHPIHDTSTVELVNRSKNWPIRDEEALIAAENILVVCPTIVYQFRLDPHSFSDHRRICDAIGSIYGNIPPKMHPFYELIKDTKVKVSYGSNIGVVSIGYFKQDLIIADISLLSDHMNVMVVSE